MPHPRRPLDSIPEDADASYRIGALREIQRALRPLQRADLIGKVDDLIGRVEELEMWRREHSDERAAPPKTPKVTILLPDGTPASLPSDGKSSHDQHVTANMLDAALNERELERLRNENAELRAKELRAATEKIDWTKWLSRSVLVALLALVSTLAGMLWSQRNSTPPTAPPAATR